MKQIRDLTQIKCSLKLLTSILILNQFQLEYGIIFYLIAFRFSLILTFYCLTKFHVKYLKKYNVVFRFLKMFLNGIVSEAYMTFAFINIFTLNMIFANHYIYSID